MLETSLHLIDFGTTRRIHSQKVMAETKEYLDKDRIGYGFSDDIYSSRFILAALFPDLYRTEKTDQHTMYTIVLIVLDEFTVLQRAIVQLMHAMSCPERSKCPLCQVIVQYLNALSVSIKQAEAELTWDLVQNSTRGTLQRPASSIDDFYTAG